MIWAGISALGIMFVIGLFLVRSGKRIAQVESMKVELEVERKENEAVQEWNKRTEELGRSADAIKEEARKKFADGSINAGELTSLLSKARPIRKAGKAAKAG